MKKEIKAPLQLVLRIVFVDKFFVKSWSMDYRPEDIARYQKMDKKLFEPIWGQLWNRAVGAILAEYPKGWRSYEAYAKAFEMVMKAKTKENEKLRKKGLPMMSKKEWNKGIPKFDSTLKPEDIRIIVVGQNCWTRLFDAKNLNAKTFTKIINDYKI